MRIPFPKFIGKTFVFILSIIFGIIICCLFVCFVVCFLIIIFLNSLAKLQEEHLPNSLRQPDKSHQGTHARRLRRFIQVIREIYVPPLFYLGTRMESVFYVGPSAFGGVGLFARRRIILEADSVLPYVIGYVYNLSDLDWDRLREMHFPSLYQYGNNFRGIMVGPLSLANHCCSSTITFTKPNKHGVVFAQTSHQQQTLQPDQELLIYYGLNSLHFLCVCPLCRKHISSAKYS